MMRASTELNAVEPVVSALKRQIHSKSSKPDTASQDSDRRVLGQHIGGVLRYARNAAELNLKRAPLDSIRRELGHAIDCAGLVVWGSDGGRDD